MSSKKLPFASFKNFSFLRRFSAFRSAFTLFEVLIYIAIAMIALLSILQIGQNFIAGNVKAQLERSLSENARLAFQELTLKIRGADDVITANSTFNAHPGVLTLDYPGTGTDVVFNTYLKTLTLNNGTSVTIRKLQMQDGSASAQDVTNDEVDVTNFVVRNLTQSTESKNIEIEVTLKVLNPSNNPQYNLSTSLETAVSLRK